jgi:PAP_fibrillin
VVDLVRGLEAEGWSGEGSGPLGSQAGLALLDGPWELSFQMSASDLAGLSDGGVAPAGQGPGRIQAASIAVTDGAEGNRGAVIQRFDVKNMMIENRASGRFVSFRIEAAFSPVGDSQSEVGVRFYKTAFRLWPIPWELSVPISWFGASGRLDTTYLSDEIRIGRGDKGTLFCLVRPRDIISKRA